MKICPFDKRFLADTRFLRPPPAHRSYCYDLPSCNYSPSKLNAAGIAGSLSTFAVVSVAFGRSTADNCQ